MAQQIEPARPNPSNRSAQDTYSGRGIRITSPPLRYTSPPARETRSIRRGSGMPSGPQHGVGHVDEEDAAEDQVAAGRALAHVNDTIKEALERDGHARHARGTDAKGRLLGHAEPDELAVSVRQGGRRGVHGLAQARWDEVDDELAGFLDVPKGVLGLAAPVVDGAEQERRRLGADAHEEAEGGEVGSPRAIHGGDPGDGSGKDGVDHPLVHIANGGRRGVELHGGSKAAPRPMSQMESSPGLGRESSGKVGSRVRWVPR